MTVAELIAELRTLPDDSPVGQMVTGLKWQPLKALEMKSMRQTSLGLLPDLSPGSHTTFVVEMKFGS